jgi:hypothetical protein
MAIVEDEILMLVEAAVHLKAGNRIAYRIASQGQPATRKRRG